MIISCSIVVVFSRRSSCRSTIVRMARKPFWLSLSRQLNRQLMHAVMNELPVRRKNSSNPPCSSLDPPLSRDADTWSARSARIGSTSSGMSSGSCDPSASRKTVTGVRMCGMARRIASPFPRPPSAHHAGAALRRDLGGAVGRLPGHDDAPRRRSGASASTTPPMLGASCFAAITADTSVATWCATASSRWAWIDRVGEAGDVHRARSDVADAAWRRQRLEPLPRLPQRPASTLPRML